VWRSVAECERCCRPTMSSVLSTIGWSDVRPWMPWIITSVSMAYVMYIRYKVRRQSGGRQDRPEMNPHIDKHKQKVKHVFKGDDLQPGKKLSLCRCWRSETFPLCDGSHKAYNKQYNDNVGPVNIEWSDESEEFNESKTLAEPDIQSMNASTELSSLEMIDSNGSGDNGANSSTGSHSNDESNHF